MDTSTPTGAAGPDPAPGSPAPDQPPTDTNRPGNAPNSFFTAVRRLGITRSDDRWIGGVSGGVGDRFGIDPLLVRGIFFATLLLGGIGLVAYGVAWALLPERRDGRIHLEEMILGRFDIALLGALAFVIVGFGRGDNWFFFWGPPGWVQALLWVSVVGGIVMLIAIVSNQQSSKPRPPSGPYVPYGSPTTYPAASYPASPVTAAAPVGDAQPVPPAPAAPAAWSASYAPAPPAPRPVQPPRPVTPPRPRTPGAGVGTVGVVVALSLLSLAVLLIAERQGDFTGPVGLTALGIGIVLCGLGIIVSGLRGRTSGGLGGLAVVGILVAVPLGAVQNASWVWSSDSQHDFSADGAIYVTDRADAANGYSIGFGDVTIDLTEVPMTSQTLVVPISLAAGDLTVVVPSDASISADVDAGAGTVSWDVDGESKSVDGVGLNPRTFTTGAIDDDGPQLALQVQIGAGDVSIIEEN
ncbi:PspC domain-containing protein [Cellulomonas humilata]|uniref:Phage shock protein PspC (Stress-responsive transcriptional regulator) n=1 Tax=Cellulomonas humilata TaxID=144055 RepID=A0ABU0ED18_9CELL|nr:PspC domain-containing protein [Cellulomonas humilata]MDQ0372998.1 phage shock protein PspC (stress-responsive transcriptional regulator) [Cellulomonas humilata]